MLKHPREEQTEHFFFVRAGADGFAMALVDDSQRGMADGRLPTSSST